MVTLNVGDICVRFKDGTIPPVCFERKSHADLVQSLSKGYERFRREIFRAQEQGIQLIIAIEKPVSTILKGYSRSLVKGITTFRKLLTLRWKYGVEHIYFRNREEMATYIYEYYCHYYLKHKDKLWLPDPSAKSPKPFSDANGRELDNKEG